MIYIAPKWPKSGPTFDDYLSHIAGYPRLLDEIIQLMDAARENIAHVTDPLAGRLSHLPLRSHARYQREELLAALEWTSLKRRPGNHREGVAWSEKLQTDLLLVNLHKDEAVFSPTTMYRDVPVSPELFDWETQSGTSQSSPTGRRYLNQGKGDTEVLLAVRNSPQDEIGAAPFTLLGTADYVSHAGERPIQIRWQLRRPMPADILAQASVIGI